MKQAIQTNSLNDTILIPLQLITVSTGSKIPIPSSPRIKNDIKVPVVKRLIPDIDSTYGDTSTTTATTGSDGTTSGVVPLLPEEEPPPSFPLPTPTAPKASFAHLSPPKSFRTLIRFTSQGNRRQRSVSSESSSSSTTTNDTDAVVSTVPITTAALAAPTLDDRTEIQTLSPIRFSTFMMHASSITSGSSNSNSTIGSMVLLIRRPGCALCQQHAYTLTLLCKIFCPEYFTTTTTNISSSSSTRNTMNHTDNDTAQTKQNNNSPPMFTIFGIVKDIYDTVGIMECQQVYFPFPLYMNPTFTLYHAFGDRKLSLSHIFTSSQAWKTMLCTMYQNIFPSSNSVTTTTTMVTTTTTPTVHGLDTTNTTVSSESPTSIPPPPPSSSPLSSSSSSSSHKADGILQGGILFLSSTGTPMAMYPEETGQPLNIGYILQTLDYMIQEHHKSKAIHISPVSQRNELNQQ